MENRTTTPNKLLQVFAFCVINVNSTIVFEHFEDLKNLIIFNIFKEKLVNPCLLASFYFNRIQMEEGGKKAPLPASFSHVTSTNARISPQNFLTFSFNPFAKI